MQQQLIMNPQFAQANAAHHSLGELINQFGDLFDLSGYYSSHYHTTLIRFSMTQLVLRMVPILSQSFSLLNLFRLFQLIE